MFLLTWYVVIGFFIAYWQSRKGCYQFTDVVVIWAFWPIAIIFWSAIWSFDKLISKLHL